MNSDPASLANLRDIVVPPPVSWWPLAPGWWFLLVVLSLITSLLAVHQYRRWRANAYRRAALRELSAAESIPSIAKILKRAALAASLRTEVASLTGSDWVKWLAETGGRPLPSAVSRALVVGAYRDHELTDASELAAFAAFAAEWIRNHRIGNRVSAGGDLNA
jgi:hypothetical protein